VKWDGLFWVLFWAVAKECLARGARTAMPHPAKVVKIKRRKKQQPA